jgi:hypothetical protein
MIHERHVSDTNQREDTKTALSIAVVVVMIGSATIGFEGDQVTPDMKNLFTSIAEKNQ